MKKYEFTGTNELTEKAFQVYSDSSFTFWKNGDTFFYSDNLNSEKGRAWIAGRCKRIS